MSGARSGGSTGCSRTSSARRATRVNPDGQPFEHVEVTTEKVKSVIPYHVVAYLRVKNWLLRRKLRKAYGQDFLDHMDKAWAEVEREFLYGKAEGFHD